MSGGENSHQSNLNLDRDRTSSKVTENLPHHPAATMEMTLQEIPEDPNEEEDKKSEVLPTPYQKLLETLHDSKFSHEVALEKRVGLYKFCGDIGRGNFSRVKKAVHLLTKGGLIQVS